MRFLREVNLPDYLEEALAPFAWTGIFSNQFRHDITVAVLAPNREESVTYLVKSIRLIKFLDAEFVGDLCTALLRFGKEGFGKR